GPVLAQIDERVSMHVQLFQNGLTDEQRNAALVVFAFFVGVDKESRAAAALRSGLVRHSPPARPAPVKSAPAKSAPAKSTKAAVAATKGPARQRSGQGAVK